MKKNTPHIAIGDRFKAFRQTHMQYLQKDLAEEFKVSKKLVSDIETGKFMPNATLIQRITDKYQLNAEWLFSGKGNPLLSKNEDMSSASVMAHVAALEKKVEKLEKIIIQLTKLVQEEGQAAQ